MILLVAAFLTAAGICEAQSPGALEQSGKLHFREAYFKAIPANDQARAAREFALAERDLKKALTKRPARISLYKHLGRTYFVQQKYVKAADTYQKAIDLSPNQKPIYLQLASAQEMAGNPEEAIRTLNQLRRLESDPRAIKIIDGFIQQLNRKVVTDTPSKKQRQVQP
jgi:tetratricopeptide (TPR) repeat protein